MLDNLLLTLAVVAGMILIVLVGDNIGAVVIVLGITNRYLADIHRAIKVQGN